MDRFLLVAIQMFGGIVVSSILMFYTKTVYFQQLSPFTIFIGLLFGLCLMLNNYLMLIGFHNYDLNLGTIILSSELVFASVFGFLFYKEIPTLNEIIESSLIVFSIILSNFNFSRKK